MRQTAKALLIILLLPVAALAVMAFPYLEFRRFIEPLSIDPALTSRVLAVIERHSDFQAGQFRNDVSHEVCSWEFVEEHRRLTAQPGWQLTARRNPGISFKKTSFWPWDRHGLSVASLPGQPCSAAVHRSDTI